LNFQKYQLKENSHRIVLNTIRQNSEISGADIARKTNYQPSTISYILKKLEQINLIEFSRIGLSQGSGKPPTLWKISDDLGFIFGIECLLNEFRVSLINATGKIEFQERYYFDTILDRRNLEVKINETIHQICHNKNIGKNKILGIGIALPGLIDSKNGFVHYSRPFNIKESYLQKQLEQVLTIPSFIINDANAGALGIKWFQNNNNKLFNNIIFLTVNDITKDLGAGIIINKQLFDGVDGSAGEMLKSLPDVVKLIATAKKRFNQPDSNWDKYTKHEEVKFSEIVSKAKTNDKIASFILQKFGQVLVDQILQIIGFYNPAKIVLGGDITTADFLVNDFVLPGAKKQFAKLFPSGITFPEILYSPFGIFSVSIGAAALILREIYSFDNNFIHMKEEV